MKILIVDDEWDVLQVLKSLISSKGHEVDSALDGRKALDLIKRNAYHVVIVDHDIPELTGLELVEYMKKHHSRAGKILMTGYAMITESFAKSCGADEYLFKPFNAQAVEAVLEKYEKLFQTHGPPP